LAQDWLSSSLARAGRPAGRARRRASGRRIRIRITKLKFDSIIVLVDLISIILFCFKFIFFFFPFRDLCNHTANKRKTIATMTEITLLLVFFLILNIISVVYSLKVARRFLPAEIGDDLRQRAEVMVSTCVCSQKFLDQKLSVCVRYR
jgi:hypothetical protein